MLIIIIYDPENLSVITYYVVLIECFVRVLFADRSQIEELWFVFSEPNIPQFENK